MPIYTLYYYQPELVMSRAADWLRPFFRKIYFVFLLFSNSTWFIIRFPPLCLANQFFVAVFATWNRVTPVWFLWVFASHTGLIIFSAIKVTPDLVLIKIPKILTMFHQLFTTCVKGPQKPKYKSYMKQKDGV